MNDLIRATPFIGAIVLAASALAGCAPPLPPRFVKLRDLGSVGPLELGQPIVIELDEGDVIPLRFTLDGPFVKSAADAPAIPLRVTRHFFLRLDKEGLKSSADGKHFDWKPVKPGQFQFGVGATKEGVSATMSIRTPTPPGLGP